MRPLRSATPNPSANTPRNARSNQQGTAQPVAQGVRNLAESSRVVQAARQNPRAANTIQANHRSSTTQNTRGNTNTQSQANNQTQQPNPLVRVDDTRLADLKINENEKPSDLILIPNARQTFSVGSNFPHPEANEPRGKEYLKQMGRDLSLPDSLGELCGGPKLGRSIGRNDTQVQHYEKCIRYVAHRLKSSSPATRETFREDIAILANEASTNCGDRTQMFMDDMVLRAYIDEISDGARLSTADLFNFGASVYKRDRMQAIISNLYSPNSSMPLIRQVFGDDIANRAFDRGEELETQLQAQAELKNRLGLPMAPAWESTYGKSTSILTEGGFTKVADVLDQELLQDDAFGLFTFLASWDPWINHLEKAKDSTPVGYDFEKNEEENRSALGGSLRFRAYTDAMGNDLTLNSYIFHKKTRDAACHKELEMCESRYGHTSGLYNQKVKEIMAKREHIMCSVRGETAKSILFGERVGYLSEELGRSFLGS